MPSKEQIIVQSNSMMSLIDQLTKRSIEYCNALGFATMSDAEIYALTLRGGRSVVEFNIERYDMSHLDILQWIGFDMQKQQRPGDYIMIHWEQDIRVSSPLATTGSYDMRVSMKAHKLRNNIKWMTDSIKALIIESDLQDNETNHQRQHS